MINQDQQDFKTIGTNPRAGFRVLSIGGVAFVQPQPGALTDLQTIALRGAAQVAALGRRKVAEAIVAQVQRELGVSPDLYVLGVEMGAAAATREEREDRARKAGKARRVVITANRNVAEPRASKEVGEALSAVEEAMRLLRKARREDAALRQEIRILRDRDQEIPLALALDANRARTASWAAVALMRVRSSQASALRRDQLDAFWADHANSETTSLAGDRGEEIGQVRPADLEGRLGREGQTVSARPVRISSRDGLATLFESGKISAHHYGAGRAYRLAYEMAGKGLKIANLEGSGGGGAQHGMMTSHRSAHELQKAYVLARLRQIELAVEGIGARELAVLRWVAGAGHTIRSLGGSGNAREADAKALVRALEAAVRVLAGPIHRGLERSARRPL